MSISAGVRRRVSGRRRACVGAGTRYRLGAVRWGSPLAEVDDQLPAVTARCAGVRLPAMRTTLVISTAVQPQQMMPERRLRRRIRTKRVLDSRMVHLALASAAAATVITMRIRHLGHKPRGLGGRTKHLSKVHAIRWPSAAGLSWHAVRPDVPFALDPVTTKSCSVARPHLDDLVPSPRDDPPSDRADRSGCPPNRWPDHPSRRAERPSMLDARHGICVHMGQAPGGNPSSEGPREQLSAHAPDRTRRRPGGG